MKNWTAPVCLCIMLFSLVSMAQGPSPQQHLDLLSSNIQAVDNSILFKTERTANHSTLLKALRASDMDCILDYKGQFTVFAPSNAAFKKLSKVTMDELLDPKNKEELKAVMSYHIIAGKLTASKILKAMCRGNGIASFTTVLGEKITATMSGIDIILMDNYGNKAKIVSADSNQSNGVVHEIDSVFLPFEI
ncbi:fasciclin domain-containing protein [Maribacter thermophilus]|uniref:fasciclin domain-containing protein n=1 Tax=Maribacter thermophilus TaxID=1197874 RepID=UPI00069BD892|nr:fasciclin domain-containing protein [Maribacter thermophilus]